MCNYLKNVKATTVQASIILIYTGVLCEKNVHIIRDGTPWECFTKFEIYAESSRLSDSRSIYVKTVQVDIEFFPSLPMSFLLLSRSETSGVFARCWDQPSRLSFTAYFSHGALGLARMTVLSAFPSRIEVFTLRELIIHGTAASARISGYNLARRMLQLRVAGLISHLRARSQSTKMEITSLALREGYRMNERRCCSSALRR